MNNKCIAAIALAASTVAPVQASAQSVDDIIAAMPGKSGAALNAFIARMRGDCHDLDGGSLAIDPYFFENNVDFDSDGVPDTMFGSGGLECSTTASFTQGTGGTVLSIFLSSTGEQISYSQHDHMVLQWHGVPVLLLFQHGSACDRYGYQACTAAYTFVDGQFGTVQPSPAQD